VKIDLSLDFGVGVDIGAAVAAERSGYDALWLAETRHDPLISAGMIAARTERITIGTSVFVAFARNPMTTAVAANDLQLYSEGRFLLGLGSQIKAHITRRFSMPWSEPARRMEEYIQALRAIWDAWATGAELDFQGEFYTHTLMTPMFDPGTNPHGNPPILIAGVGPQMTRVAGAVADGFLPHAVSTERYLRAVTLPTLAAARAGVGKDLTGFEISGVPFIVTGATEEAMIDAAAMARKQVAFYASTPAYRTILELHGWAALGEELTILSKRREWDEMARLIDDDMLGEIAIVAEPQNVAKLVIDRYGDLFTRVTPYPLGMPDPELWTPIVEDLRSLSDATTLHPEAPR